MFCKIGFDKLPKSKKVRRHDHLVKPVYAKEKVGSLTNIHAHLTTTLGSLAYLVISL